MMASVAEDLHKLTDLPSAPAVEDNPFFIPPVAETANTNKAPSLAVHQKDQSSIVMFPTSARLNSSDTTKAIVESMKGHKILNYEMGGGSGAAKVTHDHVIGLTQCSSISMYLVRSTHIDINKAELTDLQFELELDLLSLVKNEADRMEKMLKDLIMRADLMSAGQKAAVLKLIDNTLTLEKIHAGELALPTTEIEVMAKETLELLEELLDADILPFDMQMMSLQAVQQIAKLFPDMDLQAKIDELAQKVIEPYVAKLNELLLSLGDGDFELKQIIEDLLEALKEDPLSIESNAKIEVLNEVLKGQDFGELAQELLTMSEPITRLQVEAIQAKHGIATDYVMESSKLYQALYTVRNAALGMAASVIDKPRIFAMQPQANDSAAPAQMSNQASVQSQSSKNTSTLSQIRQGQNSNVVPLVQSVSSAIQSIVPKTSDSQSSISSAVSQGIGQTDPNTAAASPAEPTNVNITPSVTTLESSNAQPVHPIVQQIEKVLKGISAKPGEITTAVTIGLLSKMSEFKNIIDNLKQPVIDRLPEGFKNPSESIKAMGRYVNETAKVIGQKVGQPLNVVQRTINRAIKNGGKIVSVTAQQAFNVASQAAQNTWENVNNYGRQGLAFAAELIQDVAKKSGCAFCFTKACELCGIQKGEKTDQEARLKGQQIAQAMNYDDFIP